MARRMGYTHDLQTEQSPAADMAVVDRWVSACRAVVGGGSPPAAYPAVAVSFAYSLATGPTSDGNSLSYRSVRGSFLILSRTPWSPNDRDKKVDSDIPGKFFDAYTRSVSDIPNCAEIDHKPINGSEVIDLICTTSFLSKAIRRFPEPALLE